VILLRARYKCSHKVDSYATSAGTFCSGAGYAAKSTLLWCSHCARRQRTDVLVDRKPRQIAQARNSRRKYVDNSEHRKAKLPFLENRKAIV